MNKVIFLVQENSGWDEEWETLGAFFSKKLAEKLVAKKENRAVKEGSDYNYRVVEVPFGGG